MKSSRLGRLLPESRIVRGIAGSIDQIVVAIKSQLRTCLIGKQEADLRTAQRTILMRGEDVRNEALPMLQSPSLEA